MANNSLDQERTLKEKLDELAAIEAEERKKQEAIQAENNRIEEEKRRAQARADEEYRKRMEALRIEEEHKKNTENAIKKGKEARLEKEIKRFSENFRREGNTVYFGAYPQSKRAKNVIVFDEKNEDGYHKASDGCSYVFNEKNGVYYKVEPIKWKVLYETDTEVKLVCDSIIDQYDGGSEYCFNKLREIVPTFFDDLTFNLYITDVNFLTTHELEYIDKKERKRLHTDYAKRENKCSFWVIKGPAYQYYYGRDVVTDNYKLDAFKNAKKAKKLGDFSIVPCIKVKKSISLEDIGAKCMHWHHFPHFSYFGDGKYLDSKEFYVYPGKCVKKGDVLVKVKPRGSREEIVLEAMIDGTVISTRKELITHCYTDYDLIAIV